MGPKASAIAALLMLKTPVHVEVILRPEAKFPLVNELASIIQQKLQEACPVFVNGPIACLPPNLGPIIESISVTDLGSHEMVSFWEAEPLIHIFKLTESAADRDYVENGDEEVPACTQMELPSRQLLHLWDSIIVDDLVKTSLLRYCMTSLHFSEASIDPDIITWNRVLLLHGPPGSISWHID